MCNNVKLLIHKMTASFLVMIILQDNKLIVNTSLPWGRHKLFTEVKPCWKRFIIGWANILGKFHYSFGSQSRTVKIANCLKVQNSLSFHWPFLNEKQSMFTFPLAFFTCHLYFSPYYKPFSSSSWILCSRHNFDFTNKFPDFSLTLTISENFSDFLRISSG